MEVHKNLGPGLLESAYEQCLAHELKLNGIEFKSQISLPVTYKGFSLECGYRIDMLVDNELILELKSVDRVENIHIAQVLTYMKLAGVHKGLLINFNVEKLKDGIKRLII
ncbi:MAG: GxxExxY protein [Lentisphaerae bacterium GWF2_38_69]|nr:MAG: GxxExxY protein [Lentisphaerae bacterium GWF2_38_69]